MSQVKQTEERFLLHLRRISNYEEALNILYWDLRTGAPKKGAEQRGNVIAMLASELFKLQTSKELDEMCTFLMDKENRGEISEITLKSAIECKKEYDRFAKIPPEEYQEYVRLRSKAETIWEEAKEKADFKLFRPYLEKLVASTKKFISYWGYEENKYNTLLDMYEPGMTVEILDQVFGELRAGIIDLLQKIQASTVKPETAFIYNHFPKERQKEFCIYLLKQMGYDFAAGRLDETVHPFEITINPYDVRVTNKYDENDFRVGIFGAIHEGGHALYEQNISKDLAGTPLAAGTSMGIHESQSLFNEIFVGRNKAFWKYNLDHLKKYADGKFDHVELEEFYRAINEVKPTLIRIEADEVTYPLHVIIRYEIEKALFNDEIEVNDIPGIWNEKYRDYLGIEPEDDGTGVLQDMHWSGGSFGYFPSYALGYMYAAQFKHSLLKDIPNFEEYLENGDLQPIHGWFKEKVHRYGKMKKPHEILEDATGEKINASYLIQYLNEKYKDIYQL